MPQTPQDALVDLLSLLVGSIHENDLIDDPLLPGMISQLIQVLNPKATSLPVDIIDKLISIENQVDRFKAAAEMVKAYDPQKLKQLADSMRGAGLIKKEGEPEETALEDLMTEHSTLRRMMAVYKKYLDRDKTDNKIDIRIPKCIAQLIKISVHDFHEKMEEEHVFPMMKERMSELVKNLNEQHLMVREYTKNILESDNSDIVRDYIVKFLDVYTPHGLKEDTELFPAWRDSMSPEKWHEMNEKFHEAEKSYYGDIGESAVLKIVESIEKRLGVNELKVV